MTSHVTDTSADGQKAKLLGGNIEEQTIEYHKVTERDADNSSKQTERLTERPGWKSRVGKLRDPQTFNTVEHDKQGEAIWYPKTRA